MTPRERVQAALEFRPPDVVPLQIYAAPGGLHEHGQKLVDLIRECGHDFGDLSGLCLPAPPDPTEIDVDGTYHAFKRDAWGTLWEYRIFGVWGHPIEWPLGDLRDLDAYCPPPAPDPSGPGLDAATAVAAQHTAQYFLLGGGGSILEKMVSIRRFEDVLMDLACDTPEINRMADMVAEHVAGQVRWSLACGVDAVAFGDDFGTQTAPLLAPQAWRRFLSPRYELLFEPIQRAGKRVFFHSCGVLGPVLEDLAGLGIDAIWPQLPAYDMAELARRCRELQVAVQLHPDRGELMQRGTPQDVRDYVLRMLDVFGTATGGSWLYIEIDPGFPYENVVALFETAMHLRG